MKELKKKLELTEREYYETHLALINCLLPKGENNDKRLTSKEIEVLACFMSLDTTKDEYRFSPTGKKKVMKQMGISPAGLSNYIRALIDKKFLLEDIREIQIWHILNPEKDEQSYMFKLINKEFNGV